MSNPKPNPNSLDSNHSNSRANSSGSSHQSSSRRTPTHFLREHNNRLRQGCENTVNLLDELSNVLDDARAALDAAPSPKKP